MDTCCIGDEIMKKRNLLLILLFLLAAVFTLAACKEGEQGAKGEQGDKGATGEKGPAGDKGPKGDTGDNGDTGEAGADAKEPEFEVTDEGVMWRLKGEEEWKVLVSVEDLIGYSKKYTITFDANGGEAVKSLEKQVFKTKPELPTPKKAGWTFAYWVNEEGEEVEDFTVLADAKLKAVWASSVELSKVALGEDFSVEGLTTVETFNVTKFNSGANDGFTIDLGTKEKNGDAAGAYWYRIFLKEVDAKNGIYEVVGRLTSGQSSSLADYPYDIMIGTHSACKDAEGYAKLKGIVEAETSPVGYIVKVAGLDLSAAAGELATPWAVTVYSGYEKVIKTIIAGEKLDLGTATATGKTFVGWTSDGVTLVNGEITPAGDIKYLPVFNYTVKFNANGGSAVADKTVAAATDYAAALPETTNDPKLFVGWFADEALTQKVEKLPLTACTLYAKWDIPTTVTYQLNGGSWDHEESVGGYADITAVRQALLDQYNAWGSYTYTLETVPLGDWANINIHSFLAANDAKGAKEWAWLVDWIAKNELSENKKSAQNYINNGYKTLAGDTHDIYGMSYTFRAFMAGSVCRSGHASWGTLTYNADVLAKVWAAYQAETADKVVVYTAEETQLPVPVKAGFTFDGWIDGESNAVTSIPAADAPATLTLTAKWKSGSLTKEDIFAEFLKDVNAAAETTATAETFYDTFKDNILTVLANDSLKAKYKFLVEFAEAKNVASDGKGNKRVKAAMNQLGYDYAYTGSSEVPESPDSYASTMVANDIHNLLNGLGTSVHTGSSSSYPASDFSAADAYDGFVAAAIAAGFKLSE